MSRWVIQNSFKKIIFSSKLETIETWNNVIFLYSKITNDPEIYNNNYLFFASSTNSPFSKDEILECVGFTFLILNNGDFVKSLTKEDRLNFSTLFFELKSNILSEQGDSFTSSIHND